MSSIYNDLRDQFLKTIKPNVKIVFDNSITKEESLDIEVNLRNISENENIIFVFPSTTDPIKYKSSIKSSTIVPGSPLIDSPDIDGSDVDSSITDNSGMDTSVGDGSLVYNKLMYNNPTDSKPTDTIRSAHSMKSTNDPYLSCKVINTMNEKNIGKSSSDKETESHGLMSLLKSLDKTYNDYPLRFTLTFTAENDKTYPTINDQESLLEPNELYCLFKAYLMDHDNICKSSKEVCNSPIHDNDNNMKTVYHTDNKPNTKQNKFCINKSNIRSLVHLIHHSITKMINKSNSNSIFSSYISPSPDLIDSFLNLSIRSYAKAKKIFTSFSTNSFNELFYIEMINFITNKKIKIGTSLIHNLLSIYSTDCNSYICKILYLYFSYFIYESEAINKNPLIKNRNDSTIKKTHEELEKLLLLIETDSKTIKKEIFKELSNLQLSMNRKIMYSTFYLELESDHDVFRNNIDEMIRKSDIKRLDIPLRYIKRNAQDDKADYINELYNKTGKVEVDCTIVDDKNKPSTDIHVSSHLESKLDEIKYSPTHIKIHHPITIQININIPRNHIIEDSEISIEQECNGFFTVKLDGMEVNQNNSLSHPAHNPPGQSINSSNNDALSQPSEYPIIHPAHNSPGQSINSSNNDALSQSSEYPIIYPAHNSPGHPAYNPPGQSSSRQYSVSYIPTSTAPIVVIVRFKYNGLFINKHFNLNYKYLDLIEIHTINDELIRITNKSNKDLLLGSYKINPNNKLTCFHSFLFNHSNVLKSIKTPPDEDLMESLNKWIYIDTVNHSDGSSSYKILQRDINTSGRQFHSINRPNKNHLEFYIDQMKDIIRINIRNRIKYKINYLIDIESIYIHGSLNGYNQNIHYLDIVELNRNKNKGIYRYFFNIGYSVYLNAYCQNDYFYLMF